MKLDFRNNHPEPLYRTKTKHPTFEPNSITFVFESMQMTKTKTIIDDLKWRYACKRFDNRLKLPQEDVETILEALNLTATSLGIQLLKCVVVENAELKEKLVEHAFGQRQVADCSHLIVLCRYDKVSEADIDEYVNRTAYIKSLELESPKMQGFRKMISEAVNMPQEKQIHWMNNQVYLALGNLLTVCASMHIDACPMEGFDPEKVDEVLNLERFGLKSVVLCPVGYRHEDDPYAKEPKVRKNIENFAIVL